LQCPFVRVIQSDWQFIESLANTGRHTSTQGVQLAKCPPKHPVSPLRERCDYEFPVFISLSPHCSVLENKRADIVVDVLPLTTFLVKGHTARRGCQRAKNSLYVLLGATSDADKQIQIVRSDKILHKIQYLFTGGWSSSGIRTLVQGVHDDENRKLSWGFEHPFKASCKSCIAGLFRAIMVPGVQRKKNILATIAIVSELDEKRPQQAADIVFRGSLKGEVIVRDQGGSGLSHVLDVFDNSRACRRYESPITETDEKILPKDAFLCTRCEIGERIKS
jgi:hypothetical protein